jgi:hypothetical protein
MRKPIDWRNLEANENVKAAFRSAFSWIHVRAPENVQVSLDYDYEPLGVFCYVIAHGKSLPSKRSIQSAPPSGTCSLTLRKTDASELELAAFVLRGFQKALIDAKTNFPSFDWASVHIRLRTPAEHSRVITAWQHTPLTQPFVSPEDPPRKPEMIWGEQPSNRREPRMP